MATVTVCLIIKNEGRYLLEWIAHYLALGVDRLEIYDNGSEDHTGDLARGASNSRSSIGYTQWLDEPGMNPQISAYLDCCAKANTDWIAFFDTDEFLVLHTQNNFGSYLDQFGDDVSAVAVNWKIFGSSGHMKYEPQLVRDRFTMSAAPENGKNRFFKTIARPKRILDMPNAHLVKISEGKYVTASNLVLQQATNKAQSERVDYQQAQLNHYVVRSWQEYLEKRERGNSTLSADSERKFYKFQDAEKFWNAHNINNEQDLSINKDDKIFRIIYSNLKDELRAKI